jgi:hypothetical protein
MKTKTTVAERRAAIAPKKFTIEWLRESQKRAAAMQELYKTNPEQARENAKKSFDPTIARINAHYTANAAMLRTMQQKQRES